MGSPRTLLPGSERLVGTSRRLSPRGPTALVLENHGVVDRRARRPAHAFERFETLEFAAKTVIKASTLGPVRYLTDAEVDRPRPAAGGPPEPRTRPVTSREKELRAQLCEFVRRSYRQRLMISTTGAFSARLDPDSFLITPHRTDRHDLQPADIVLVRRGRPEEGMTPSSAGRNHQAVYDAHPDVHAVVNAYPVNATAFAVTDAPLETRTIPESYIFLRDVPRIPYTYRFGRMAARTPPRPR